MTELVRLVLNPERSLKPRAEVTSWSKKEGGDLTQDFSALQLNREAKDDRKR
jgi:hypothetical protein